MPGVVGGEVVSLVGCALGRPHSEPAPSHPCNLWGSIPLTIALGSISCAPQLIRPSVDCDGAATMLA